MRKHYINMSRWYWVVAAISFAVVITSFVGGLFGYHMWWLGFIWLFVTAMWVFSAITVRRTANLYNDDGSWNFGGHK